MALTEVYVDPSIAADSGTGTIGDPFGDLEYAIKQTTFDTTNGTRVNIKAGTDEVLAAKLETALADTSVSVAWAPSLGARLFIQGYQSVAADGGIGGISGGGAVSAFADGTVDNVNIIDMHIHNTGAQQIIKLDSGIFLHNCEFDNTTSTAAAVEIDQGAVTGCYVHNFEGTGIRGDDGSYIYGNYVFDDGATPTLGIQGVTGHIEANIIVYRTAIAARGIKTSSLDHKDVIRNNSIYQHLAGTGQGVASANGNVAVEVSNNLVEGFSGVGGVGIDTAGTTQEVMVLRGNAVYNCTTAYDNSTYPILIESDNETLTASPFNDAPNGDFSPVDTGNVKEGSLPQIIGGGLV